MSHFRIAQSGESSKCSGILGCTGYGLKVAKNWTVEHRGTVATVAATAGCFVPAVGWAACAGMQAAAYGFRTQQTLSDGGWQKNKKKIMVDGVVTAGTGGLGGVDLQMCHSCSRS